MDVTFKKIVQVALLIGVHFTEIIHSAPHVSSGRDCDSKAADIVFALDSSSSIWDEDVHKEIKFVQSVIEHFPVGKDSIHIGVLMYGTDVHTQFNLDEFYSNKEVATALERIRYHNGSTNTGGAIRHARERMFNSPRNRHRGQVDKVMVVITDGHSNNVTNTSIEASISRSHGITLFSVGIGRYLDGLELRQIANKPNKEVDKFMFHVDDFDALKTIETALAKATCKAITSDIEASQNDGQQIDNPPDSTVKQYCGGKPSDVEFVLDSSSSLDRPSFRKMLRFVTEVVDMFDIGPQATRVGLVTYSHHVHPSIKLDNNLEKSDLLQRIRNLQFLGGGTQTGHALKYVRERGFGRQFSRQSVAHVLILITDGQSADTALTQEEARRLHEMGVYIFALGIGEMVDQIELKEMASEPKKDFMFEMGDFDALSSIKNVLAIKTCMAANEDIDSGMQNDQGVGLVCDPQEPLDVMFVYDAHSLMEKKSQLLTETLVDVMTTINSAQVRSGIAMHSSDNLRDIPLTAYRNEHDILRTTETTQSEGLPLILRKLRVHGFTSENGGRKNAKRVAFVIIDGALKDAHQTILEAKRLRFARFGEKTEVYVVVIGDSNYQSVSQMASTQTSEHVIQIPDFSSMVHLKTSLFEKVCAWNV